MTTFPAPYPPSLPNGSDPPRSSGRRRFSRSRLATLLAFVVASIGLPATSTAVATLTAGTAVADQPVACHTDTTIPDPRDSGYTHGNPETGIVSRHGYYYLDVKFGTVNGVTCGLGADGLLHVVAYVHAIAILPSGVPGNFASAYKPSYSQNAVYFLEYRGYADTGKLYSLPGATDGTSSPYVSTTNATTTCDPNGGGNDTCQYGPGVSELVLRYDGPDQFNMTGGGDIRFRIANESGLEITDIAQEDIVACSTCGPIQGPDNNGVHPKVNGLMPRNYGFNYPGTPGS